MRRAVGRPGHLDGPAAEHTIDRLLRTLPIVVGKRARAPEGSTVVIELTGPVHRLVPITVTGGRAGVVDRFDGEPLATLRLDSEVFVMLATGRSDAAVLSDRWSAQGDTALGEAIVTQLNMMI
jgi:ubiquinone biosynthesis protein UbiJ